MNTWAACSTLVNAVQNPKEYKYIFGAQLSKRSRKWERPREYDLLVQIEKIWENFVLQQLSNLPISLSYLQERTVAAKQWRKSEPNITNALVKGAVEPSENHRK